MRKVAQNSCRPMFQGGMQQVKSRSHRRTQDFTMEGFMWWEAGLEGLCDGSPPVGSRGKASVGGVGDEAVA